jgi:hypothetical protein
MNAHADERMNETEKEVDELPACPLLKTKQ